MACLGALPLRMRARSIQLAGFLLVTPLSLPMAHLQEELFAAEELRDKDVAHVLSTVLLFARFFPELYLQQAGDLRAHALLSSAAAATARWGPCARPGDAV